VDPGPPPVTVDVAGTQFHGTGIATLVCTEAGDGVSDCSAGDTYVLDYSARVPFDDPSNFGGVQYALHLEGTIGAAVPVPAAVWLFGSGLLGLVGIARRRRLS
jgi:hypothetical protein